MAQIIFSYADAPLALKEKTKVKAFIASIFSLEGRRLVKVTYIFCSDDYLLKINKDFLSHDYYTDIITFDLSEGEGVIGEVYVSVERVKENSIIEKVSFEREALRVLFHGVLHLCGYRDKKKSEIKKMREKEEYYLRLFDKT